MRKILPAILVFCLILSFANASFAATYNNSFGISTTIKATITGQGNITISDLSDVAVSTSNTTGNFRVEVYLSSIPSNFNSFATRIEYDSSLIAYRSISSNQVIGQNEVEDEETGDISYTDQKWTPSVDSNTTGVLGVTYMNTSAVNTPQYSFDTSKPVFTLTFRKLAASGNATIDFTNFSFSTVSDDYYPSNLPTISLALSKAVDDTWNELTPFSCSTIYAAEAQNHSGVAARLSFTRPEDASDQIIYAITADETKYYFKDATGLAGLEGAIVFDVSFLNGSKSEAISSKNVTDIDVILGKADGTKFYLSDLNDKPAE